MQPRTPSYGKIINDKVNTSRREVINKLIDELNKIFEMWDALDTDKGAYIDRDDGTSYYMSRSDTQQFTLHNTRIEIPTLNIETLLAYSAMKNLLMMAHIKSLIDLNTDYSNSIINNNRWHSFVETHSLPKRPSYIKNSSKQGDDLFKCENPPLIIDKSVKMLDLAFLIEQKLPPIVYCNVVHSFPRTIGNRWRKHKNIEPLMASTNPTDVSDLNFMTELSTTLQRNIVETPTLNVEALLAENAMLTLPRYLEYLAEIEKLLSVGVNINHYYDMRPCTEKIDLDDIVIAEASTVLNRDIDKTVYPKSDLERLALLYALIGDLEEMYLGHSPHLFLTTLYIFSEFSDLDDRTLFMYSPISVPRQLIMSSNAKSPTFWSESLPERGKLIPPVEPPSTFYTFK